jgi:hypothetical protein
MDWSHLCNTVSSNASDPSPCPFCKESYQPRHRLLRHLESCADNPFTAAERTCDCCKKIWKSKQSKANHQRSNKSTSLEIENAAPTENAMILAEEKKDSSLVEDEGIADTAEDLTVEQDFDEEEEPSSRLNLQSYSMADFQEEQARPIAFIRALHSSLTLSSAVTFEEVSPDKCPKQVSTTMIITVSP